LWLREPLSYNPRVVSDSHSRAAEAAATLARIVESSADSSTRTWFSDALASARGRNSSDVAVAYAGASRRLRATPVSVKSADRAVLERSGLRGAHTWSLDRIARAALVCEMARWPDAPGVVDQTYRGGDNDERAALLGVLAALPDAGRFASTAVNACRTNVTSVFEAIACENTYPAAHFSDAELNQMILKALFTGVAVARIEGVHTRANAELVRMVAAYATERRAAGRSVPADVELILSMETPPS
jgi:hypothetical protein